MRTASNPPMILEDGKLAIPQFEFVVIMSTDELNELGSTTRDVFKDATTSAGTFMSDEDTDAPWLNNKFLITEINGAHSMIKNRILYT